MPDIDPTARIYPNVRLGVDVRVGPWAIVGLPPEEGDAILEFLFKHGTRPEFIYRHQWQPRDLVVWDNRCLQHYAVNDYDGIYTRCMHRTSVQGDVPVDPRVRSQQTRASARLPDALKSA